MKQLLTGLVAEAAAVLQEKSRSSRRRPPPPPQGAEAAPSKAPAVANAEGGGGAATARTSGALSPLSAVARGERVAEALLDNLLREAAIEQRARRGASSPPSAPLPLPLPPPATPRSPLGGAPLAAAPLTSGAPMGSATFGLPPTPRAAAPQPQPVARAVGALPLLEALLEAQRRAQPVSRRHPNLNPNPSH